MSLQNLARFKVMRSLTKDNIYLSKNDAIAEIVPGLNPEVCRTCTARIFRECAAMPGPGNNPQDQEQT